MRLQGFGYNNMWFAVKDGDPAMIARALGLEIAEPCEWSAGLDAANEYGSDKVFITPCIDGWTLCVGLALLDSRAGDPMIEQTRRLAAALGTQVQFFLTNRIVNAHAWARATPEGLIRAYQYSAEGGVTTDIGKQTAEEQALGFRFFDERSSEAAENDYWNRTDLTYPSEESVMRLAGKWSINPTEFEGRDVEQSEGFLAIPPRREETLPRPRTPKSAKPWWKFW